MKSAQKSMLEQDLRHVEINSVDIAMVEKLTPEQRQELSLSPALRRSRASYWVNHALRERGIEGGGKDAPTINMIVTNEHEAKTAYQSLGEYGVCSILPADVAMTIFFDYGRLGLGATKTAQEAYARELCHNCPMMMLCRSYSDRLESKIGSNRLYGIAGGESPRQRINHRAKGRVIRNGKLQTNLGSRESAREQERPL